MGRRAKRSLAASATSWNDIADSALNPVQPLVAASDRSKYSLGCMPFDDGAFQGSAVAARRGVGDLSALMAGADIAVSAVGSTLYELCCMGVPTAALPIVENQLPNAQGFAGRDLRLSSEGLGWREADAALVRRLARRAAQAAAVGARLFGSRWPQRSPHRAGDSESRRVFYPIVRVPVAGNLCELSL